MQKLSINPKLTFSDCSLTLSDLLMLLEALFLFPIEAGRLAELKRNKPSHQHENTSLKTPLRSSQSPYLAFRSHFTLPLLELFRKKAKICSTSVEVIARYDPSGLYPLAVLSAGYVMSVSECVYMWILSSTSRDKGEVISDFGIYEGRHCTNCRGTF